MLQKVLFWVICRSSFFDRVIFPGSFSFLVCFRNITGNQKQTDKISHVTLDFQTRFHRVSYMLGSLVLESMASEEGKPESQLLGTDWEKASYTLPVWCWTSFCAQETTSSSKDKVIPW